MYKGSQKLGAIRLVLLGWCSALILVLFSTVALASDATLWAAKYTNSSGGDDRACAVVIDSSGNSYVTGYDTDSLSGYDYCTIKYDPFGNQVWLKKYNGPGNSDDQANALVVDSLGNVYVTGYSTGAGTNNDYCTVKYDSAGNQVWVQRYNGPANGIDKAIGLTVDSSGNVYVTGYSDGGSATKSDYCTVKYDSAGNQIWVQRYNGPLNNDDQACAVAVDSSGNVYVTGYYTSAPYTYDYCTIKYGSAGNQIWVKTYNGPGNSIDQANALALDSSGNIYVTGYSYGSGTYGDYCTIKYDPAGNQVWVQRYNGPANSDDKSTALAVDSSGSVYITGYSYGSGSKGDYCTIKYDSAGNQIWVQRYNGPANSSDQANALAFDSSGNVYVTGYITGSGTGYDYCTIKYDATGNQLWVQVYSSSGNVQDNAKAVAIDASGNTYVVGYSGDDNFYNNYCAIKYDSAGNQLWVRIYNGSGGYSDEARAIALDSSKNVYVTGYSSGSGTNSDYCTVKYDSAGNQIWVQRYNGPRNSGDSANAIATDSSGNVYATGYSQGSDGSPDYCTIKYDSAGNQLWVQRYSGSGNSDYAVAMAVDSAENVYITGSSYGSGTGSDYCTVKYDSAGNQLWVQRYNGPANKYDEATSIALDASGSVYVTGRSDGGNGTGDDYCTIKYDRAGNQLWVQRYNRSWNGYDRATAIAVDPSGNVLVTGCSTNAPNGTDYCTIKYDSSGNQLWIQRYDGPRFVDDNAYALALDSSGNVYVTGCSSGNGTDNGTENDYCTIKYDSAGDQKWVRRYNGPGNGNDLAYALAVDSSANVYVTGYSPGNGTGNDYCTIKYDSAGDQKWVQRYSGPGSGDDQAVAMALDYSGNAYITGCATNAYRDYMTIAYAGADPIGSITINGGARYTAGAFVSLNVSAAIGDGASIGNTVASMRFSNDGISWSDWLPYASVMSWTLVPGEGVKTVYAQFKDSIGNVSQIYSDSIIYSTMSTSKKKADSSAVWVSGMVTAVFGDSFYLEAPDRSMAIRVDKAGHGVVAGNAVEVSGTIFTDDMGERYVAADEITPGGNGSVSAVALTNRALGGGDYKYDPSTGAGQRGVADGTSLNNIGMLVTISGKVICLGSDFFYIDDGTGAQDGSACKGVKVTCGDAIKPQEKQYVTVVGISSIMKIGDYCYRCLKMLPGITISIYNNQ